MEIKTFEFLVQTYGQFALTIVGLVFVARWYLASQDKLITLFEIELAECRADRDLLRADVANLHKQIINLKGPI